jgi:hypothetical protein
MNKWTLEAGCALTAATVLLAGCATTTGPKPPMDARTQEVLDAMSAKLASANTIRFSGTRTAPPGFHAAVDFGERTEMRGALRRPREIAVTFTSSEGNRALGYNGSELILVDYKTNTHARSPAPPTPEATLRAMDATYDFIPPASEVLVNHPEEYLLEGVLSVRHAGQEVVEGVACDHLVFQQKTRRRDLWVGTADHLPRRVTITYPNEGATPVAVTTFVRQWQLNAPVSDADVTVAIPAGSKELEAVRLRR